MINRQFLLGVSSIKPGTMNSFAQRQRRKILPRLLFKQQSSKKCNSLNNDVNERSRRGNEVSNDLAPLSPALFTEGRGSDGSISSMRSILYLWEAAFSDCCGFFTSSGVSGKDDLCSIIERTLEGAYCCGASSLSRGIPKPALAEESVITSCNLSVYGFNWPNKVGRSILWITSSIGSV